MKRSWDIFLEAKGSETVVDDLYKVTTVDSGTDIRDCRISF